jgi:K+-sensing histidine kinase KdpD
LKISVIDTGSGIPSEVIPHLFKEFGTFDNEDGVNNQGVGLGLCIC